MPWRSSATGKSRTSRPSSLMVPSSGMTRRLIDLSRVVLPEPEGPTKATKEPSSTDRVTPSSAARPPCRLVSVSMSRKLISKAWWARQGLNLRPHPCEGCALPLSYAPTPERKRPITAAFVCVQLRGGSAVDRVLQPLARLELGLGGFLDLHRLPGAGVPAGR